MLLGTLSQVSAQDLTQIMKPRPADYEYLSAPDSLGVRHQLLMPNISNRNTLATQSLPYPIIFIHGLASNSLTWGNTNYTDLMHNFFQSQNISYGGRFDYNLNSDGNNNLANKLFWPTPNADITSFTSTAVAGDYYFVNFDVSIAGAFNPGSGLSNQSAIAKQGVALADIIQRVMNLTTRDKVILMGHSMGGLAAREYLQNPGNWTEPNVNHHIAKLVTTGTPHGGSNATGTFLVDIFIDIDEKSEAVRDLRKSYTYSLNNGVFLFGGIESNNYMWDMLLSDFYNVDVNCNGITGENLSLGGLNQKDLYNNLDYSCIIGTGLTGLSVGDGVVTTASANLNNNYPGITQNIFNSSVIHTNLPKQIGQNMQGLDEPYQYNLAYRIGFNQIYKGFITEQSSSAPYTTDYDDYKFTLTNTSNVSISINKSTSLNLYARIVSNNQTQIGIIQSNNGSSNISFTQNNLAPGNYFLEIYATPTVGSIWPYSFSLSTTLSTDDFAPRNSLVLYPNPTSSKVFFDNSNYNFKEVAIYNYLGQKVATTSFIGNLTNQEIDMSGLAIGIYVLKFSNGETSQSIKIIKQ